MGNLYVGLLHFPMLNRCGEIVATATTSLDVHDIARTARTYGVARYFVITPLPSQRQIGQRICGFWTEGERAMEKSNRGEALEIVAVAADLEETLVWIGEAEGASPLLVATSARQEGERHIAYADLKRKIRDEERPVYILFGTGWGMVTELIDTCNRILPPVMPESDFNHLSVRAAAAIILDRVAGESE